jgi:hypothetical protein
MADSSEVSLADKKDMQTVAMTDLSKAEKRVLTLAKLRAVLMADL